MIRVIVNPIEESQPDDAMGGGGPRGGDWASALGDGGGQRHSGQLLRWGTVARPPRRSGAWPAAGGGGGGPARHRRRVEPPKGRAGLGRGGAAEGDPRGRGAGAGRQRPDLGRYDQGGGGPARLGRGGHDPQ